jgi:hypothetical protein
MLENILIPAIFFATVFGICYLFFTSRNRERMAMIDKGINPKKNKKDYKQVSFFTILLLNTGLLAIGVGIAILVGGLLEMSNMDEDIAYPSSILIFGGSALFIGFKMTKNLVDKISNKNQNGI